MCSLYSDITSEEVEKYYLTLSGYKSKPITTTKEHVRHIKKQSKNIDKNICPRCGAKLALRKSSKTGKEFYFNKSSEAGDFIGMHRDEVTRAIRTGQRVAGYKAYGIK